MAGADCTSPNSSFLFLTSRQAYIQDDGKEWTNSTLWAGQEVSDLALYNSVPIFCPVVWLKTLLPPT